MTIIKLFNHRLHILIDLEKISQADLAARVGVSEQQVSKWLSGLVGTPHRKTLIKLADYFKCDIDWLTDGTGKPFTKIQLAKIGYGASVKGSIEESSSEVKGNECPRVGHYRQLSEMDEDTLGEIQNWLNDMETIRPGFCGWFRLEFKNRFPEFDEWKARIEKT